MRPLFMVLICLIMGWFFTLSGSGITPLYTRDIPDQPLLIVPPLISVFQDPDTGNTLSNQMGETKILIMKNPPPTPEIVQENTPTPNISAGSRCLIQKRYYYGPNQMLIAVALLSDIPRQPDEIESNLWVTVGGNTSLQTMLEYA